jgi:serine/threonine-protein kinase
MAETERQYKPGERVPGTEYVVIRLEAEGGHGALYLVRHHFLEKKIQMLKTLRSIEPSKDLIERLKREAQMLAAMDHPHIVSVTSGGLTDEKDPRPYFVMERLKGRSLAQILPDAPEGVGVDAALKVTIELCDALEYVHVRHGVVHRDIKPDNIFLHVTPRNGSITKILDFGVAHMMDLDKRFTKNNLFLGTPRYASPEQVMSERISPQTDLYAVGLVLYELLLGKGPFDDAMTFAAVATAHVQQAPPEFPRTRRFPEGLEALVMSLLRKVPTERPRSAEWVATQLRQIKRIAELAEQAHGESLSQTDLSPMQNALTGHRAQLTEAGAPLDLASEPTMPGASTANPSEGAPDTMRAGTAAEQAPGVDRVAPTRTLSREPEAAEPPRRTDTEQLPDERQALRSSGGDARGPHHTFAHAATAPLASSTHAAVELAHDADAKSRKWAAIAGVAVALAIVGVSGSVYVASQTSRGPTTAASPTAASPTTAVSPTAASPTTAVSPTAASPTTAVSPTTAAPVPSGEPPAPPVAQAAPPPTVPTLQPSITPPMSSAAPAPLPVVTGAPAAASSPPAASDGPPRARSTGKAAPMKLPSSGL